MIDSYAVTSPLLIVLFFGLGAAIVYWGSIDIAVGIYASILFWAYNVTIGGINLLWLSVAIMTGSGLVRYLRRRLVGKRSVSLLSPPDLGLAIWMVLWAFWMFLLYLAFPSSRADLLIRNLVLYCLFSFVVIFLFIDSVRDIRRLVIAFVVSSCIAGFVAIRLLPVPIIEAVDDPLFRLRGMTSINYLSFAVPFGLAALFGFSRIIAPTSKMERVLMLVLTPLSVVLLVLTGARQSALALGVAIVFLVLWVLRERHMSRALTVPIVAMIIVLGWFVYSSTQLWERWSQLSADYQIRVDYWSRGLHAFSKSIIWGSGFDYLQTGNAAHNMIIDTLAAQGIVGFVLLLGLIIIVLRSSIRALKTTGDTQVSAWLMTLLAALVFALVQTSFSGGLITAPHFFWIMALLWRASNPPIALLVTPKIRSRSMTSVRAEWKPKTLPRGLRGVR